MKFTLRQVTNGCRLGLIESSDGLFINETTPMCMLYTRAGSVPNLTRDMLDRIENLPKIVHMSLPLLVDHIQTVKKFNQGIKKFTALQDFLVYCSVQDPAVETPTGYNDKTGISVWSKGGRQKLDSCVYHKMVDAFKPDLCQLLADSDTDVDTTRKRLLKSQDRSLAFTEDALEAKKDSKELQNCSLLGTITGGWDKSLRLASVKKLVDLDLQGVVFEGFHRFGPDTESFSVTKVQHILQEVNTVLDKHPDLLRVWHGILTPSNVLCAVESGVDLMDSSYPYIVSERGGALVFPYNINQEATSQADPVAEISLIDKKYVEDLTPVLTSCSCYTCQHHSKAYINHLLNTSEILASVLLSIHNFHHYFRFFEQLRKSLQEDRYAEFRHLIASSYPGDR